MLTPEQQDYVIQRDGNRCVVCGSAEKLKLVCINPHDDTEPANYATLCPKHAYQFENRQLRLLGTPGSWLVEELDQETMQWNVRKTQTLLPAPEASHVVHLAGNIIPIVYDEVHQQIPNLDQEHLRELFWMLDSNVVEAFKLKCHIAYELVKRQRVPIENYTGEPTKWDERIRAVAQFLEKYSEQYIMKLATVWHKIGPKWDEYCGSVPILPTIIVEICRTNKVEQGFKWYHDYVATYKREPTTRRLKAAIAMGFPPIEATPAPDQYIRTCLVCKYLERATKKDKLVLFDESGKEKASVTPHKARYCAKRGMLFVAMQPHFDMIAEMCPYFEVRPRSRVLKKFLPLQGRYSMPKKSPKEEDDVQRDDA